jgi:hypothetical protein
MPTTINEITQEVPLCLPGGTLNPAARGWSRHPLHRCNLEGRFLRKKRWDYWCIMGDRFLISATIADVDYAALGSVYLLEYETQRFAELNMTRFFGARPEMPQKVGGDIRFDHPRLRLRLETQGEVVRISAESPRFGGLPLNAEITIRRPAGHETLNVVVPWNERTFQFTSKQQCLPAEGTVRWGGDTLTFAPGTAYACLDYGRGIWPYRTTWNWAAFSGRSASGVVGANMGAKWTDGTGMNENGVVLDGRLHKIFEDIQFEYDPRAFIKPWRMRTVESDAVDLTFTPFYDKITRTNLLVLRSEVHQLFGHYTGTLRFGPQSVAIENIPGWAEEQRARW